MNYTHRSTYVFLTLENDPISWYHVITWIQVRNFPISAEFPAHYLCHSMQKRHYGILINTEKCQFGQLMVSDPSHLFYLSLKFDLRCVKMLQAHGK